MNNQDSIQQTRQRLQGNIPPYYNAFLFFGFTNILAAIAIFSAAKLINGIEPVQWLTVPAVFLFANLLEYNFHRGPMHSRWPALKIVFRRHSLQHHAYFPHNHMAVSSAREAYLILFPIWTIFLVFGVATPAFLATWYLTSSNVAGLFLITAICYFLLYEWLHLCYHLPETNRLTKLRFIKSLKQHHLNHHNPKLMTRYNFNITFPIGDWLMGTIYRSKSR